MSPSEAFVQRIASDSRRRVEQSHVVLSPPIITFSTFVNELRFARLSVTTHSPPARAMSIARVVVVDRIGARPAIDHPIAARVAVYDVIAAAGDRMADELTLSMVEPTRSSDPRMVIALG